MNPRTASFLALAVFSLAVWFALGAQGEPGPDASGDTVRIDPAAYRSLVDENLGIRKERDRLALDLVELRKRNASLLIELQDLERRRDGLAKLLAEMKTPDETRAELARLQTERAALADEVGRLRRSVGLMATNAVPIAAPTPGSDLFRRLEQENAALRMELSQARNEAQAENRKRETSETGEKNLKAASQVLAGQIASLKRDLESARKSEAKMKDAMTELARKVYALKTETQRLQEEAAAEKARKEKPAVAREPAKASAGGSSPRVEVSPEEEGRKAMAAGKSREAEKLFLVALQKNPRSAKLHYNLGVLYEDYLDDPGKAAFHYRKYLELDPAAPDASTVSAWLVELDLKSKW